MDNNELNALRRENAKLKKAVESAKDIHMMDMAEIAFLRRQVDFLMEGLEAEKEPGD